MSGPMVKLADIANVVTGATPKKRSEYYDGDVPFVTPGDLGETSGITSTSRTLTQEGADSVRSIPAGSVMVCCIGATIGKVGIAEKTVVTNQQINSLVVDERKAFPKYVYYYCATLKEKLKAASSSTTMPIVNKSNFSQFEIPLPPLDEQKRIAAILDKADAIRQKRKQASDLADEFLRSVFLDMFGDPVTNPKGWEVSTLNNFGSFKNGMNFSKDEVGNQLYCIGVGDFKSFDRICGTSRLSTINLNEIPDNGYLLQDNDLLFVRSNGNKALVGRCVSVHPGSEEVTFSGFCIRYRIELVELLDADFVNYCLRIPSMKHAMLKGGQGANIQNINQQILSNLQIPVPPIELQKKYATLVASFRDLQEKLTSNQLVSLEAFNSLSQQAFSGQL